MIKVEFDFSQIKEVSLALGAAEDQIPFAIATALNRAADVTRNFLVRATWPQHVNARNASFMNASLTTRGARADKRSAAVEIYDKLDRGNLQMQAKGGTRQARGNAMAIPASNVPRGSHGVPGRLRPKVLGARAFRKGDALYVKDKKGRMRLLYVLKSATPIPRRVPFYEDFANSMRRELMVALPIAIQRAMSTRRR